MERKLLCQLFTVTSCSTLARHALKFARLLSIQFCSSRYWAMPVSSLVLTSRRSRDRNQGFVFVFIQINTFTYLRKMSMYQTNSVYVKLLRDVSDIYDLKSVFMGPLKAMSGRHCVATTAPRNCCPSMQNRVTKTMSVAPPLGNNWSKRSPTFSHSLAQHHLSALDLLWANFFVRVQLTSLLLISPGLWYKADDDDVELHVVGCRLTY